MYHDKEDKKRQTKMTAGNVYAEYLTWPQLPEQDVVLSSYHIFVYLKYF